MLKVVLPVSAVLSIVAILGALSFMGDLNQEVKEGDVEGVVNVSSEKIVEEANDEIKDKILAPFIPYLIGGIVAIGKLFGISLIIR